jgi:hypothetical protein
VPARGARRPGQAEAHRVVAFADGRSESPGESRSRALLHFLGRVDLWWEERHTVGEFDGLVKYGRSLSPGQDPADVLVSEKRREDALRDSGVQVVRWMRDGLDHFVVVVRRLQRAFDRPGPARSASDGRARQPPATARRPARPAVRRPPASTRGFATSQRLDAPRSAPDACEVAVGAAR